MKKTKSFLVLAGLSTTLLLSGCAAAVMTTASTIEGSDGNAIVVSKPTTAITTISKVTVDTAGVDATETENTELSQSLQKEIIDELQVNNLWNPASTKGQTVEVIIRSVEEEVKGRAIYALINVKDTNGNTIYSFAYTEKSKGLRTISHVKEKFAENVANQILSAKNN